MFRHILSTTIGLSLLVLFVAAQALADGTQQTRLVGTLTAINGQTLTVGNVTITCNDSTKYRRDASPSTATSFSDLQANQTLRVYYGTDNIATLVNITGGNASTNPGPAVKQSRLVGTLTAINGQTLTVGTVTITCNASTRYRRDASPSTATSFSDLQANQTLRVYYGPDNVATLVNITK